MAVPPSVGARFRQRKISVKQTLQILRQSEVPDLEKEDQQRELQHVETGVEKHEETEVHLQRIMRSGPVSAPVTGSGKPSAASLTKSSRAAEVASQQASKFFIPTPDASKLWKEAKKYYTGSFHAPSSYLKTSATVEDTCGVPYCMDEEDEEFLIEYNKQAKNAKKKPLLEDEYEIIIDAYETVIKERQPFIVIDPTEILGYEQVKEYALVPKSTARDSIKESLKEELHVDSFVTLLDPVDQAKKEKSLRLLLALLDEFGQDMYDFWKKRKIEREGRAIIPELKFEDPADKNNDDDPYICFRRREFRQHRKTRKTDIQSAEKLKRLHIELKSVKMLISLVAQRELRRKESLLSERDVFENRCKVKTLKRELGIKGEEEDLVQHKKKKIIQPPKEEPLLLSTKLAEEKIKKERLHKSQKMSAAALIEETKAKKQATNTHITAQPYVKLPASKIPDMDLETVGQVLMNKNSAIEKAVNDKLRQRQLHENNEDWINLTDDSMNPFFNLSNANADIQEYTHLPYSSIISSLFEVQTSNYLNDDLRSHITTTKPSDMAMAFDGSNGQKVTDTHLHSLLDIIKPASLNGNVPEPVSSNPLQPEQYTPYEKNSAPNVSEPIFRLRKRVGRGGRVMVDRRGLLRKSDFSLGDFMDIDSEEMDVDQNTLLSKRVHQEKGSDIYDSQVDKYIRHDSRWKFDNDFSESMKAQYDPFGSDPSKLNCISNDTQSIRFGSMLLSKAYESYREAQIQRQQVILHNRKRMQLLQQQRLQQITQAKQAASQQRQLQQQQKLQSQQQKVQPQPTSQLQQSTPQPQHQQLQQHLQQQPRQPTQQKV